MSWFLKVVELDGLWLQLFPNVMYVEQGFCLSEDSLCITTKRTFFADTMVSYDIPRKYQA